MRLCFVCMCLHFLSKSRLWSLSASSWSLVTMTTPSQDQSPTSLSVSLPLSLLYCSSLSLSWLPLTHQPLPSPTLICHQRIPFAPFHTIYSFFLGFLVFVGGVKARLSSFSSHQPSTVTVPSWGPPLRQTSRGQSSLSVRLFGGFFDLPALSPGAVWTGPICCLVLRSGTATSSGEPLVEGAGGRGFEKSLTQAAASEVKGGKLHAPSKSVLSENWVFCAMRRDNRARIAEFCPKSKQTFLFYFLEETVGEPALSFPSSWKPFEERSEGERLMLYPGTFSISIICLFSYQTRRGLSHFSSSARLLITIVRLTLRLDGVYFSLSDWFGLGYEYLGAANVRLHGGRKKGSDSLQAMLAVAEVDFKAILRRALLSFSLSPFSFFSLIIFTVPSFSFAVPPTLVMSHPILSLGATGAAEPGD